jgi:hypothetical protein
MESMQMQEEPHEPAELATTIGTHYTSLITRTIYTVNKNPMCNLIQAKHSAVSREEYRIAKRKYFPVLKYLPFWSRESDVIFIKAHFRIPPRQVTPQWLLLLYSCLVLVNTPLVCYKH